MTLKFEVQDPFTCGLTLVAISFVMNIVRKFWTYEIYLNIYSTEFCNVHNGKKSISTHLYVPVYVCGFHSRSVAKKALFF